MQILYRYPRMVRIPVRIVSANGIALDAQSYKLKTDGIGAQRGNKRNYKMEDIMLNDGLPGFNWNGHHNIQIWPKYKQRRWYKAGLKGWRNAGNDIFHLKIRQVDQDDRILEAYPGTGQNAHNHEEEKGMIPL